MWVGWGKMTKVPEVSKKTALPHIVTPWITAQRSQQILIQPAQPALWHHYVKMLIQVPCLWLAIKSDGDILSCLPILFTSHMVFWCRRDSPKYFWYTYISFITTKGERLLYEQQCHVLEYLFPKFPSRFLLLYPMCMFVFKMHPHLRRKHPHACASSKFALPLLIWSLKPDSMLA